MHKCKRRKICRAYFNYDIYFVIEVSKYLIYVSNRTILKILNEYLFSLEILYSCFHQRHLSQVLSPSNFRTIRVVASSRTISTQQFSQTQPDRINQQIRSNNLEITQTYFFPAKFSTLTKCETPAERTPLTNEKCSSFSLNTHRVREKEPNRE